MGVHDPRVLQILWEMTAEILVSVSLKNQSYIWVRISKEIPQNIFTSTWSKAWNIDNEYVTHSRLTGQQGWGEYWTYEYEY